MTNQKLASLFVELADIMEIAGENHFRIRSYRKAAANIANLDRDIKAMSPEEIEAIPGVGKAIFDKIQTALKDGTFPTLEKWRATGYASLRSLLKRPAITPRKLSAAIRLLKVESIDDIKRMIMRGELQNVTGIDDTFKREITDYITKGE
jgi:DNA polymerase (family 10)